MKSYRESAKSMADNQKLTSVVVQNVEKNWLVVALTTCDQDGGTQSERFRKRCTRVVFELSVRVNLLQRLFANIVFGWQV